MFWRIFYFFDCIALLIRRTHILILLILIKFLSDCIFILIKLILELICPALIRFGLLFNNLLIIRLILRFCSWWNYLLLCILILKLLNSAWEFFGRILNLNIFSVLRICLAWPWFGLLELAILLTCLFNNPFIIIIIVDCKIQTFLLDFLIHIFLGNTWIHRYLRFQSYFFITLLILKNIFLQFLIIVLILKLF